MQPGVYELKGPVTVIQAIAMARGLTAFASRKKIFVVNPSVQGWRRLHFNDQSFLDGQKVDQMAQ